MKLYTPGHAVYTDTLILYMVCRSLYKLFNEEEFEEKLVGVRRIGQLYEIGVKVDVKELAEAVMAYVEGERDKIYTQLASPRSPLGLFREKDVDKILEALRDEDGLEAYLKDITIPGHAVRAGEGRVSSGGTIKLPLMPSAGKYKHTDVTKGTKYATCFYKVCSYCMALSMLGFLDATYPIMGRHGRIAIIIPFDGTVDAKYFTSFFRFHHSYWMEFYDELRKMKVVDQLPVRVIIHIVASLFSGDLVRSMAHAPAGWYAMGACFAGRFTAPEVRGLCSLELTSFIEGMSKLYEAGLPGLSQIKNLIRVLASHGEAGSLDALFKFVSSREVKSLYEFVRGAYSTLEHARVKNEPGWKSAFSELYHTREMAKAISR